MTAEKPQLRGDAAYRAERDAIAKRNDVARAAGVQRRAVKEAEELQEAARRARSDARDARLRRSS